MAVLDYDAPMKLILYFFSRQDWTAARRKHFQDQTGFSSSSLFDREYRWHSLKQGMHAARRNAEKDLSLGFRRFVLLTDESPAGEASRDDLPDFAKWMRSVCPEAECHIGPRFAKGVC